MGVEHIVIVGDFFQSPADYLRFGSTDEQRIRTGLAVFLPVDYEGTVHYISSRNHDPQISQLQFQMGSVEVRHLDKESRFEIGGHTVVVTHGEEFFRGTLGGGFSWLSQKLGLPLLLERIARARIGLQEDIWLITAHSHVPALHEASRTANTGSFGAVPFNDVFRIHVGTGIRFDDNSVELVEYEGITPTLWH